METPVRQKHKIDSLEEHWHQILQHIARKTMQVWITQQHVKALQSVQAEQPTTTHPLNHSRLMPCIETAKASNQRRTI